MSGSDTHKPLNLALRRVIACVGIILFLIVYIYGVMAIGTLIGPDSPFTLIFYAIAGILWGVPILPLISWSEAYRRKRR